MDYKIVSLITGFDTTVRLLDIETCKLKVIENDDLNEYFNTSNLGAHRLYSYMRNELKVNNYVGFGGVFEILRSENNDALHLNLGGRYLSMRVEMQGSRVAYFVNGVCVERHTVQRNISELGIVPLGIEMGRSSIRVILFSNLNVVVYFSESGDIRCSLQTNFCAPIRYIKYDDLPNLPTDLKSHVAKLKLLGLT